MNKYYVTFGQNHYHDLCGIKLHHDVVAEFSALSYDSARMMAFQLFSTQWCWLSDAIPSLAFYSQGIVNIDSVVEAL